MAEVAVPWQPLLDRRLPAVCAISGAPADSSLRVMVRGEVSPGALATLEPGGFFAGTSDDAWLQVPVARGCKRHERRRRLVALSLALAAMLVAVGWVGIGDLLPGVGVLVAVALAAAAVVVTRRIRPMPVARVAPGSDTVLLVGVHPDFAAAVTDHVR